MSIDVQRFPSASELPNAEEAALQERLLEYLLDRAMQAEAAGKSDESRWAFDAGDDTLARIKDLRTEQEQADRWEAAKAMPVEQLRALGRAALMASGFEVSTPEQYMETHETKMINAIHHETDLVNHQNMQQIVLDAQGNIAKDPVIPVDESMKAIQGIFEADMHSRFFKDK